MATGWTEPITVRSKGERIVAAGLDEIWLRFPFAIAGIHSDNGSEGGFNWSSQHLDPGGVRWEDRGSRCRRRRLGLDGSGPPQRRLLPLRHPP
ncbi:MAG: hypothetical protein LH645_04655 [Actinomycetia bacterium]|nr:hypothetical protein [Actinomycetes bacterium]